MHNALIVELTPIGRLEEDIVESLARLTWCKQNLLTYRIADEASCRYSAIHAEIDQPTYARDRDKIRAAREAAEQQAQKELGAVLNLVETGEVATTGYLLNELSLVDRLDGMIDRCLKRLLFVRGLKSFSASSSAVPARKKLSAA